MSLLSLPYDLQENIISYLTLFEFLFVKVTCRDLHRTAESLSPFCAFWQRTTLRIDRNHAKFFDALFPYTSNQSLLPEKSNIPNLNHLEVYAISPTMITYFTNDYWYRILTWQKYLRSLSLTSFYSPIFFLPLPILPESYDSQNLDEIQQRILSGSHSSLSAVHSIAAQLPFLETLSVAITPLKYSAQIILCFQIQSLQKLTLLRLSNVQLYSEAVAVLLSKPLSSLICLHLCANYSLTASDVQLLNHTNLPCIQRLCLFHIRLENPFQLPSLPTLTSLIIPSFPALSSLSDFPSLISLQLSALTNEEFISLPSSLSQFPNLLYLCVSSTISLPEIQFLDTLIRLIATVHLRYVCTLAISYRPSIVNIDEDMVNNVSWPTNPSAYLASPSLRALKKLKDFVVGKHTLHAHWDTKGCHYDSTTNISVSKCDCFWKPNGQQECISWLMELKSHVTTAG